MAIKPENNFIKSVHNHLTRDVYRMKNHNAYVAGIPDVWYSGPVGDLWVEYKYIPIKKPRTAVIADLSRQQLRWIRDRKEEGRDVWVIVGYKPGGVVITDMEEMEHGLPPETFVLRTKTRSQLALEIHKHCTEPLYETKKHEIKCR